MANGRSPIRMALPFLTAKPREEIELERGLLTGVAAFRWATWVWMAVVLGLDVTHSSSLAHAEVGIALVALALVWTGAASVLIRVGPSMLLDRWALAIEFAIAAALVLCDWYVYGGGSDHSQSLGSAWPLAVILTVGIAYDGRAGAVAGVVMGLVRLGGQAVFYAGFLDHGDNQIAATGTIVFYALAGGVAGFVTVRLRGAEREIAIARAREEVGATLHDGVLQTLAIVQRRANDPDLVSLAREQEHELRQYLFSPKPDPRRLFRPNTTDLGSALRAVAADAERRHGIRTQVVLTEDVPLVLEDIATALGGAVGEALTNASKHGDAAAATVFVEPRDDQLLFCSVKDTGSGFDPARATEGIGISRSIRGRIREVGGEVEIDGRPGRGTEVRITIPTG